MSSGHRRADGERRGWSVRRASRDLNGSERTKQLKRVFARDEGVCCWCGKDVKRRDASREHMVPLKDGGSTGDENVKLAHKACNNDRDQRESGKEAA